MKKSKKKLAKKFTKKKSSKEANKKVHKKFHKKSKNQSSKIFTWHLFNIFPLFNFINSTFYFFRKFKRIILLNLIFLFKL